MSASGKEQGHVAEIVSIGGSSTVSTCLPDLVPDDVWVQIMTWVVNDETTWKQRTRRWQGTALRGLWSLAACNRRLYGLVKHTPRIFHSYSHQRWPRLSRDLIADVGASGGRRPVDWQRVVETYARVEHNVNEGRQAKITEKAHDEWVTCVKFVNTDRHSNLPWTGEADGLVSCSYDGTVKFWTLSTDGVKLEHTLQPAMRPGMPGTYLFSCLQFNDEIIAVGDIEDNTIKIWDLSTGEAQAALSVPIGLKDCIDLNERVLLAGCEDAKLRVYSATSQESLATLAGHAADKMISCVKLLSPSTALTGSADRTLKLWDLEAQRCVHTFAGHAREIFCADTDDRANGGYGGDLIISGARDKKAYVWDQRTSKCVQTLEGHTGTVVCLRFDDSYIATAGGFARGEDGEEILGVDSSVRLWDIRTMRCIQNLEQTPPSEPHNIDGDPVLSLDLKPSMLVSAHSDQTLRVWNSRPDELRPVRRR